MYKVIILLLLTTSLSYGQKLNGKYVVGGVDSYREFIFKDNSFTEKLTGDMGSTLGVGTFKIDDGKLVLEYLKVPDQDSSSYTINYHTETYSSFGSVSVKVLDEEGKPCVSMIGIRDPDGNYIMETLSENGKAQSNINTNKHAGFYSITAFGYYSVFIPVSRLIGKKTDVVVKLKPAIIAYRKPETVIWKIEKNTKSELIVIIDRMKVKLMHSE